MGPERTSDAVSEASEGSSTYNHVPHRRKPPTMSTKRRHAGRNPSGTQTRRSSAGIKKRKVELTEAQVQILRALVSRLPSKQKVDALDVSTGGDETWRSVGYPYDERPIEASVKPTTGSRPESSSSLNNTTIGEQGDPRENLAPEIGSFDGSSSYEVSIYLIVMIDHSTY